MASNTELIQICGECFTACTMCYNASIRENLDCWKLCHGCAELNAMCAKFLSEDIPMNKEVMQLTLKMCEDCFKMCSKHNNEYCRRCSETCKKVCDSMHKMGLQQKVV